MATTQHNLTRVLDARNKKYKKLAKKRRLTTIGDIIGFAPTSVIYYHFPNNGKELIWLYVTSMKERETQENQLLITGYDIFGQEQSIYMFGKTYYARIYSVNKWYSFVVTRKIHHGWFAEDMFPGKLTTVHDYFSNHSDNALMHTRANELLRKFNKVFSQTPYVNTLPKWNELLHLLHNGQIGCFGTGGEGNPALIELQKYVWFTYFLLSENAFILSEPDKVAKIPKRVLAAATEMVAEQVGNIKLTSEQIRIARDIIQDLNARATTTRMLLGDVGSGKGFIAYAVLSALTKSLIAYYKLPATPRECDEKCRKTVNKFKMLLYAPRIMVAEQHYERLGQWFSLRGISNEWIVNSKQEAYPALVTVGTQWLIPLLQNYRFFLSIIDEPQYLGLNQFAGNTGHLVLSTATPLPRWINAASKINLSVMPQRPRNVDIIPVQTGTPTADTIRLILNFITQEQHNFQNSTLDVILERAFSLVKSFKLQGEQNSSDNTHISDSDNINTHRVYVKSPGVLTLLPSRESNRGNYMSAQGFLAQLTHMLQASGIVTEYVNATLFGNDQYAFNILDTEDKTTAKVLNTETLNETSQDGHYHPATNTHRFELKVPILYIDGKMPKEHKTKLLQAWRALEQQGIFYIAVATRVVEAGIDIPTLQRAIIIGAEILGAIGTYQTIGRVGRNESDSEVWLFSSTPWVEKWSYVTDMWDIMAIELSRGAGNFIDLNQSGAVKWPYATKLHPREVTRLAKLAATYANKWDNKEKRAFFDSVLPVLRWYLQMPPEKLTEFLKELPDT